MSRALAAFGAAIGPLAWVVTIITYGVAISRWLLATQAGSAAALLALPPLMGEIAVTRAFEVPCHGWRRGVVVALAARLLLLALLMYLFVWLPLSVQGSTYLWLAEDLSTSHLFLRIVWLASPWPAMVLAAVCGAAYLGWTVRQRRGRLITTMLLPGTSTVFLFLLMYQFPDAAIRGPLGTRPAFVTRVWTRVLPEHRFPREVMVTTDERHAVATFGSTLAFDRADPPPNNLALDPQRCDPNGPNPGECRRNLALIELASGTTRTWTMPVTRRFYSESNDRYFVVPWNISNLLELGLDGSVRKHPLPERLDGIRLREVNKTYYAAASGRVYITYESNPVLLVWNAWSAQLEQSLSFAGWNGIKIGDSTLGIARSRSRQRLYVMVRSHPHVIVEVDETTLTPVRSIRPAPDAYDIQLSPDESALYMSSFFSGRIWRYDTATLTLTATLDAPIQCRRMIFSPDGSQLFAASYLTGEMAVYDTSTNEQQDLFYVAPRLEGMHVAGAGLYLLSAEGLYRIPLDVLKDRASARAAR